MNLSEDYELLFTAGADPLYIDPEELVPLFSEARLVDILEFVHFYSLEVKDILALDDDFDLALLPPTAREYVLAATACALSKIYEYAGGADEASVHLGDLSIMTRSLPRGHADRANAANWCQLAAVLRGELLRNKAGMRAIVKGSNFCNPIPTRELKNVELDSW